MLCTRCNKNIAVVFITKLEGSQATNEGICLQCAKELGIKPIEHMMNGLNMDEEQLENLQNQMMTLMEGELDTETGNQMIIDEDPMAFVKKLFGKDETKAKGAEEKKPSSAKDQKEATNANQKKKRFLDSFGINLTEKARLDHIDRVIGRHREIDRVVQILNRRTKNNPVLLGEPGVGKTAIAEGLALRIVERQVPPKLFNRQIYLLDFTAMVAGTQFRGQFEARLKGVIDEVKQAGNIILVIDELHNIVGAGEAEGAMSAANILKPALARGDIQVIGATTLNEYRKHIEKDSALERRFQPVMVDEPSVEDTIEILKGIKDYYESYHHVKIADEVIKNAVILSERYITDRFLPDKAIDVIDEAGSRANLKNEKLVELTALKEDLAKYQEELDQLTNIDPEKQDYHRIADIRTILCRVEEQIITLEKFATEVEITYDDIAYVIEAWTKIPMQRISELESSKLMTLEDRLHQRVIGQEEAVSALARAIRRSRAGIKRKKRPASFIFVGPTGVGKTELVKTLAETLFDSEEALIRLDMSEYMEKHSVSKIIGSPPGYVGYDEAGQLTEKVRRRPYSVLLFDEVEKAHADVFNILLQILEDGRITDSHGKVVNFENTVIIMTSNAGSDLRQAQIGFNNNKDNAHQLLVEKNLREVFRPEFLNRVDEIIVFKPLTKEQLFAIIDLLLQEIKSAFAEKNMDLAVTDEVKTKILETGYDERYGARPLRRTIQTLIEDPLADKMIKGDLLDGAQVTVSIDQGEIVFFVLTNHQVQV